MKFTPSILSCSYENFCFHVGDYSFGFNGKDKESEFRSGAYDFGARIHDARLGRWMSVDADYALYLSYSPYCFAINMPISIVDVDGNRIIIPTNNRELKKAIKLMLKSEIGKKLYREIKRSKTEIVYISVDKLAENKAGATYSIVSDGHTLNLKGSSLSLDDVDVDRELIKNGTIKVFHIIINENLIVKNGFSKLYRIAFALFHELDMHVKGHIEGDQEDSETHVSKEHEEGGMKSLVDDQGEYDGFVVRQFSRTSKFMHQIQSYLERKGRLNQQEVSDLKKVRSDIENYVVDREVFNELPNPATREEVEREKAKENEK